MNSLLKLVIGSGTPPLHPFHSQFIDESYILIDKYVNHPQVCQMDAANLEFPANSCSDIYASHVLEHLIDPIKALREWHRVLTPEGRLRVLVPDLRWACEYLLQLDTNPGDVDARCEPFYVSCEDVLKIMFGSQSREGEFHYTGFTPSMLEKKLEASQFKVLVIETRFDSHQMQSIYAEASAVKVKLC